MSFKGSWAGAVVMLSTLVLGGGDCGGPDPETGCSTDAQCMAGEYCRDADGHCYSEGFCYVPSDCPEQGLIHVQCVGGWTCGQNTCGWQCSTATGPGMGETCGSGDSCGDGLTCIHYYGIAGPSGPEFTSCERPCSSSSPCPVGETCVSIADGPGQVCRARNG